MRIFFFYAVIVLSTFGCSKKTKHVTNEKQIPRYIFVLNAKNGSYDENKLVLHGINTAIYFSDRPQRIVGHMSMHAFANMWEKDAEPFFYPAVLATLESKEETTLQIAKPQIEENTITFDFNKKLTHFPKTFENITLFIDMVTFGNEPFSVQKEKDFHSLTCSCGERSK